MNEGLNIKAIDLDEVGEIEFTSESLKRIVDIGYRHARKKHPELPESMSFRQQIEVSIAETAEKKRKQL